MFNKLLQLFSRILSSVPLIVPAPIQNLKRTNANVKIVWEPSLTAGVINQKIIISHNDIVLISKDIAPETSAFSFASLRGSTIKITIIPFNGVDYGDPASITFVV